FGYLTEFTQGEQFGEIIEPTNLNPGEPYALTIAAKSDAVEPVVPVAPSDQRQSMRTGGGRMLNRTPTMFEQSSLCVRNDRHGEAFCLLSLEWFTVQGRDYLVEGPGGA